MGMLSNKDLVNALIVNLKNWDWTEFSKFSIDKDTGDALIQEYELMKREGDKT